MHKHSPSWYMFSSQAVAHIRYDALVPAVVFTGLAVLVVALRWYSRAVAKTGSVGMEDYLVTAAMVLSIGMTSLIGGEFHIDTHLSAESNLPIMLKLIYAQSLLYHLAINLVKSSFCIQYLRLFSLIPPIVYACTALLIAILGAAAWGVFGVVFLCNPIDSYWNIMLGAKCTSAENHFFTTSVLGIVLDWCIWLLPIPVVGRLRLPRRQKAGLLCVFGLGGVVCTVSILRLILVQLFAHKGQVTKSATFALTWSTVELNVAIICASLLVMKPLFTRFVPALVSDQPMSAAEDARLWRGTTGLHLLQAGVMDEEKQEEGEGEEGGRRRDTGVAMGGERGNMPRRVLGLWDGSGSGRTRWSW